MKAGNDKFVNLSNPEEHPIFPTVD